MGQDMLLFVSVLDSMYNVLDRDTKKYGRNDSPE